MTDPKRHYNPTERTEADDLQVQNALDNASANQLAGFVDDLLEQSDQNEGAAAD